MPPVEMEVTFMKIVVIGGSGLIGSKLVTKLRQHGHEAVAASPNSGVNTFTGEGRTERHLFMVEDIGSSPESRVFGQKTGAHDFENGQPPCSCECQNTLRNYSRSHTYQGLRGALRYRLADRPGHLHRWRSHDTAGDLRCTDQRKRVEHLQPILQERRAVAFHPSWADRDKAEDSSGWVTKRRPRPTWRAQKTAGLRNRRVF